MPKLLIFWWRVAQNAWAETFVNRWTNALFFIGKAIRFGMLLAFLMIIRTQVTQIQGYSSDQLVVFFLTFHILDTLSQVIFRGVYLFSWQVRSGELDMILIKPIPALFAILLGKPDMLDALFLFPSFALIAWVLSQLSLVLTPMAIFWWLLLCLNSLLIITALHIIVICLGVLTTEVDNAVMFVRDLNNMTRFPVDLYREPVRTLLYVALPVGAINTIPAQWLLGVEPAQPLILTLSIGIGSLSFAYLLWRYSVQKYTSAGG
jgi:ABC-2 type transport system permease protein